MVDSVIEPICKISHRRLHPASHVADVLQCNHLIRASSNCMAVCKNYDTGYISLLESFKPANAAKPASWQAKGQLVMLQKAWFKSEHFWLVGAWWALRHCYLQSINQMTWKAGSVKRPSADANEDKELEKWRKMWKVFQAVENHSSALAWYGSLLKHMFLEIRFWIVNCFCNCEDEYPDGVQWNR